MIDIIPPATSFTKRDVEEMSEGTMEEINREEEVIEKPKEEIEQDLEEKIGEGTEEATEETIEEGLEEEDFFSSNLFTPKPKKKKKFILIGISCLALVGIIFCFTLSKAKIIIEAKTEAIQFQIDLNIDKNIAFIDLENNKIPGQIFQVEKEGEKEFPATQEKELEEKAKGTITVYNQFSSAPQTLVRTTRFASKNGKIFKTVKTVVIPGAKIEAGKIIPSSIDIQVEAIQPGDKYNINPTSFTIPGFKGTSKYSDFYGESSQPMAGGIVGKVMVVSEEDIQGAKEILAIELKEKAKKELEKRTPSDLKILKDAISEEIIESSSNIEANHPAEKFTLKVKVVAKVLAFYEKDAVSLINDNFREKIEENKSLLPETIEIEYAITNSDLEKGIMKLDCKVKENLAWKVNVEGIKKDLKGKSEINVRQYLSSRPEIKSARVIFWPFWVKKIPSDKEKIEIEVL